MENTVLDIEGIEFNDRWFNATAQYIFRDGILSIIELWSAHEEGEVKVTDSHTLKLIEIELYRQKYIEKAWEEVYG